MNNEHVNLQVTGGLSICHAGAIWPFTHYSLLIDLQLPGPSTRGHLNILTYHSILFILIGIHCQATNYDEQIE